MADGSVKIDITADDSDVKKKFKDTEDGLDGLGKKSDKTKKDVDDLGDTVDDTSEQLDDMGDSAAGAEKGIGVLGVAVGNLAAQGLSALISKLGECVGSLFSLAEETVEYREDMAKLDAAFTTAGHSSETASSAYKDFYAILGESDRSVEAVNHLAELTQNEKEVAEWADIAAGVTAKFGDSLPIEGLTEAANETAKVGKVTGPLADALNWAGISEDEFNKKLAACNSEQERATLITETLSSEYEDAAAAYNEATASIQGLREAEAELQEAQAKMGESMTPLVTLYKSGLAGALNTFAPQVAQISQGLQDMFNGVDGGSEKVVSGISDVLMTVTDTITNALPTLIPLGVELISSLATGIMQSLPQLISGVGLLISEIAGALPDLMSAIVDVLPTVIESIVTILPELIPQVVSGISEAVTLLANNASSIIDPLISALPDIIISIVDAIMTNLPLVIEGTISLVMAIVEAIPQIIDGLVQALPTIISLIISGLLKCLPQIIGGLIQVVWGIVKSLPSIFGSLIEGIGNIFVGIWDGIKEVFASIGEWFSEKFSEAWEAIQDAWSSVVDWFSGIWDSICGVFKSVGNWFKTKFDEAVTGIKNAWSSVVGWFSGIWNSITGVFASVGGWFRSKFNEAVSGIKNAWSSIKSFFTSKWNEITGVFKNAKDKFLSIGKNIVDGIKQGIKNAWNNLKEWFKGLFGDLIGIAKKILGIKSPSREFKYIAEMIVKGLEKGLKEYRTLAIKGIQELGSGMIEAMQKNAKEQVAVYTKKLDELEKAQKAGNKSITDEQIKAVEDELKVWEDKDKALETYAKKFEGHLEEFAQIEKDYASDVLKVQEKLQEDIDKEWDNYQKTFENRVSAIKDELGLFDIAEKGDKVNKGDLFKAVESQLDVLDDYNAALDTLMSKTVDPAFIEEMKAMGIDALPALEAINSMTDEELDKYVSLWQDKNVLASDAATDELTGLKEETANNVEALKIQAEKDLTDLRTTYRENWIALATEIGEGMQEATNSGLEELGKQISTFAETGAMMMEGLIEGMESKESQVIDLLVNNITSAIAAAKEAAGIHSPSTVMRDEVGSNLGLGLIEGFHDKMRAIKQAMSEDMQNITASVKATVGLENARYGYNAGVADTGILDLTRAVGMQTAGINSLAGQFNRGSQNMRPVIIELNGRELGRSYVDLGGAETVRYGAKIGGVY